jgi:hypothetical protein
MIADTCRHLTSIDLAENLNINSDCIKNIIEKCSELRNLSIEDCTLVTDEAFSSTDIRTNLQNINIDKVPIHDCGKLSQNRC